MRYLALHTGVGRMEDDGSVALLDVPGGLAGHLALGRRLGDLDGLPAAGRLPAGEVVPGTPAPATSSTWGIGLNYRSKLLATGRTLPDRPTLFLKAPAAGAAPGEPIRIPAGAPDCVDYEGEIAVLLGESLYEASPGRAAAAVRAVAAANDVTARDVMRETGNPTLAKSYPGFAQLGSAVLDPDDAGGFGALALATRVNGEVRQSDVGGGMILAVPDLLSLLSHHVVLRPGDVVLTGTPAGTGDEARTYLAPGDEVEVEVAGLPALRSAVVDGRGTRVSARRPVAAVTSQER
ncbi:MAG: fumarylacetoacetate hydrolase family protein [Acidimicrobiales bacterium]